MVVAARADVAKARAPWRLVSALLLVCSTWGFTYVVIKVGLRSSSPEAFAALRALCGGLVIGAVAAVLGRPFPRSWRDHGPLALLGLFNVAGFLGLLSVSVGEASLLIYTQPLWVAAMAPVVLGERLTARRLIGLGLGFGGAVAVLLPGAQSAERGTWWSYGALILAAVSWATATIYYRRIAAPMDPYWMTALQNLYGTVPLAVAWLLFEPASRPVLGWGLYWTIAYTGAMSSGLAYLLWFWMLRQRDATLVGISVFLVPPFAVLFGSVFLGEQPALNLAIGIFLVLCGLAVTRKG